MNYRDNAYIPQPQEPETIIDAKRFLPRFNYDKIVPWWKRSGQFVAFYLIMFSIVGVGLFFHVKNDDGKGVYGSVSGTRSDCFKSHIWKHQEVKSGKPCQYASKETASENCLEWHYTPICDERIVAGHSAQLVKFPPPKPYYLQDE